MNKFPPEQFDEIKQLAGPDQVEQTLDRLIETLRSQNDFHQLFEALKMQIRHKLGLPILYTQRPDELDAEQQHQLECGLLDACREVGTLFFEAGKLREGWIYLQPVGDPELNHRLIEAFPVTDDNAEEVIDISLMQLAAPAVGFSLVLSRYGTCNAITSFDSSGHNLDTANKKRLARLLTNHIYRELTHNLTEYLADNQVSVDPDATFLERFQANKKLVRDTGPMTDATHLSSMMRIGRVLDDSESIRKLSEMAEYGCQLAEPFHFPGEPPFENTFRDHFTFYRALCSENPDSPEVKHAVQFFDQKSRSSENDENNPVCDEVFVDLLHRIGLKTKAIEVSLERLSRRSELAGIASPVYEIATRPEHFSILEEHYHAENDLLGYTVSLLLQQQD